MVLGGWIEIDSSSISRVCFNKEVLDIEFKETGKIFRYYGVSSEVFNEMLNSSSIGRFFIKSIRGKFKDSQIEINELISGINKLKTGDLSVVELSNLIEGLLKDGLSENELYNLCRNEDDTVRTSLALVKILPEEILLRLAKDSSEEVRSKVSIRTDLPKKF